MKQIFNCLALFKNLNVLDLSLDYDYERSNQIRCQSLKELKLLTHLKVEKLKMNDIFFEDIDKHLPQLKHLSITVDNRLITNKAMNSLSKVSKLISIEINCRKGVEKTDILPNITDSGLIDVINNCPQIDSIVFKVRPNISHKTIDALIALALRKPRIRFKHYFYGIYSVYIAYNLVEVIHIESDELPDNLVINSI
jgi:hypothetical protein